MFFKKSNPNSYIQELSKQQLILIKIYVHHDPTNGYSRQKSVTKFSTRKEMIEDGVKNSKHFYFDQEGTRYYPIFTSSEKIQHWMQNKPPIPDPSGGMTVISEYVMSAAELFRRFKDAPPAIVALINPSSEDKRILTHEEMQALAKL